MEHEADAVARLERCGKPVEPQAIQHLTNYFLELRGLEESVNLASPSQLSEGHWAILGLVSRAYELSLCCVEMLASKNWNGFYAGARGMAEAVAAVNWAREDLERLPRLVRQDPIVVGRVLSAGYRRHPELKPLYRRLSFAVHPARDGHLLGPHPEREKSVGKMTAFSMDFSDYFFGVKLNALIELTAWFAADMADLCAANDGAALNVGRAMVKRRTQDNRI